MMLVSAANVAIECEGQVDLEARQFENIDPRLQAAAPVRGSDRRYCRPLRTACLRFARMWWVSAVVVDLPVGAGNTDHLVRRQRGAGHGEQFDIADHPAGHIAKHAGRWGGN